jgi:hypothetical protein
MLERIERLGGRGAERKVVMKPPLADQVPHLRVFRESPESLLHGRLGPEAKPYLVLRHGCILGGELE